MKINTHDELSELVYERDVLVVSDKLHDEGMVEIFKDLLFLLECCYLDTFKYFSIPILEIFYLLIHFIAKYSDPIIFDLTR